MPRRIFHLGLAAVLVLTGSAAPAEDSVAPDDDALAFYEFLGFPEAESALWIPFLDSLPDQPDESVPIGVEVAEEMGEDK